MDRVCTAVSTIPTVHPLTTLTTQSNLVVVPALVYDKADHPVFGLNADDFVLTDDGVPQKLILEQDTDSEPISLVVLIEAGANNRASGWQPHTPPGLRLTASNSLPIMVETLVVIVPHRIAVVGFDSGPELLQDFTPSMDAEMDTIRYMNSSIDGDGGAAILDALAFSLDLLGKQPPQYRRAILPLSENNDHGSKTPSLLTHCAPSATPTRPSTAWVFPLATPRHRNTRAANFLPNARHVKTATLSAFG